MNLQVYNSSSTSLVIRWNRITSNPAVSAYMINLTNSRGVTSVMNVSTRETETEVGGLYRYSRYCVTVTAITEGMVVDKSERICAFTAIDGERIRFSGNNQGRNEVCGINDQTGGIRDQKSGIWDHSHGIKDHKPLHRDQQFFY